MVSARVFGTSECTGSDQIPSIDCPARDVSGYVDEEEGPERALGAMAPASSSLRRTPVMP
jgi:hypothetical protein